jgi:hypothetical protein
MQSIYEASLFVCFVCTAEIHPTGMLQIVFLVSLEALDEEEGCMGLVPKIVIPLEMASCHLENPPKSAYNQIPLKITSRCKNLLLQPKNTLFQP